MYRMMNRLESLPDDLIDMIYYKAHQSSMKDMSMEILNPKKNHIQKFQHLYKLDEFEKFNNNIIKDRGIFYDEITSETFLWILSKHIYVYLAYPRLINLLNMSLLLDGVDFYNYNEFLISTIKILIPKTKQLKDLLIEAGFTGKMPRTYKTILEAFQKL